MAIGAGERPITERGEGIALESRRPVGVLLPASILLAVLRGRPTYEAVHHYTAAADSLDLDVVLFSLQRYDSRRETVDGFVYRDGRWTPWTGPLPPVVHNRQLPGTGAERRLVQTMARRLGDRFFNPLVSRDKWRVWQQLAESEGLRRHLPRTWPLTPGVGTQLPDLVRRSGSVLIKPRIGSWGLGIRFIDLLEENRFRITPARGRPRIVGPQFLAGLARRLPRLRSYIVQETIPLLQYRGRRCDVRFPVQRDGRGRWSVLPGTLKQASGHRYLTNIARGGKAYDCAPALAEVFGPEQAARIMRESAALSLTVAEQLSRHYPALADLGLDLGIDGTGKPWVIEVNFRDQRLPSKEAGQLDVHARTYQQPMAYARYLLNGCSRLNSA